jgi:hypothetical protein
MLNYIKYKLLSNYIAKNKKLRQKKLTSLKQAKTVGLLWFIEDENSYKHIFSLFTRFQQAGKTVRLIGYTQKKSVPFYCLQQLATDYFCKKDLNFYGIPKMIQIKEFLDLDLDLLIDFSYEEKLPFSWMIQLSNAQFIAGSNPYHQEFYDLFIPSDRKDYSYILEQIHFYTQQLMGDRDE